MVRYKLSEDFGDKRTQFDEEHNAMVKKRLED
jgi:hypothetical protein